MRFHRRSIHLLIPIVYVLVVYFPLLFHGGLIADDWSVWLLGERTSTLNQAYQSYFPAFSNRPLAPIYYAFISRFLGNASMYYLVNLFLWVGSIAITAHALSLIFPAQIAHLFFFLAITPFYANTVIFSPAMQSIGSLSIFLWSLSFLLFVSYFMHPSKQKRWLWITLLAATFFIYEITFPLLAFYLITPFWMKQKNSTRLKPYFKSVLVPICLTIILVMVYQKIVISYLYDDISRFRLDGDDPLVSMILSRTINLAKVLIIQMPQLCLKSLKFITFPGYHYLGLASLLLTTLAIKAVKWHCRHRAAVPPIQSMMKFFILGSLLTLIMFTVAKTDPSVKGYINRGLSSYSIIISLILAYLINYLAYHNRKVLLVVSFVYIFIGTNALLIERNNFFNTTKIQQQMLTGVVQAANQQNLIKPDNPTVIIGDIPEFLDNDFNGETIFTSDLTDWSLALKLHTKGGLIGETLNQHIISQGWVKITETPTHITLQNLPYDYSHTYPKERVWVFTYKINHLSSFVPLNQSLVLEQFH